MLLGDPVKPGNLNPRKLPPRHMSFGGAGLNGLIVHDGQSYNERGEKLPLDLGWLKRNNYHVPDEAKRALANFQVAEKPPTKQCPKCAIEMDMPDKFCKGCGEPQVTVWQPGPSIGSAAQGLIDPENPLGSLAWLLNPLDPQPGRRITAEEMGPTTEDAVRGLQEEGKLTVGQQLQGVPGGGLTGISTVSPTFQTTNRGVVEFESTALKGKA